MIRNCIVERDKDDKSEQMFLCEKDDTKCYLDGYIIMPIKYLDNIFKWIKCWFRYKKGMPKFGFDMMKAKDLKEDSPLIYEERNEKA